MNEYHRPHWSTTTKLVVTFLVLAFFTYLVFRFSALFQPLILAIILAYVLFPAVNLIEKRWRIRRGLATMLAYILLLGLIAAFSAVFIPVLGDQLGGLSGDFRQFMQGIEKILGHNYSVLGIVIDVDSTIKSMQGVFEPVVGQTLGFAIEAVTSVVWVIFIFVVAFYLVKDADKLKNWIESLIPESFRPDFGMLRQEIGTIWSAFFRGQIILALVVAILFSGIGLILGLPFPLAMGILAGLLEFLPSVGHGIWLALASLLAFFAGSTWLPIQNWAFTLLVIGLHLVYQQFDLNYLIPRIIGGSVHLPPLVVILGIVSGAVLAGVLGIVLAAPTIASARVIGRYVYANLFDLDPFQTNLVSPLPPPNPRWWGKIVPSRKQSSETRVKGHD